MQFACENYAKFLGAEVTNSAHFSLNVLLSLYTCVLESPSLGANV